MDPLLDDPDAKARLLTALEKLMPLVPGLLEPVAGEAMVTNAGVASAPVESRIPELQALIARRFEIAEPILAVGDRTGRTVRSANFDPLMTRMREVIDLDPAAVW
jgi:hypothetical protein